MGKVENIVGLNYEIDTAHGIRLVLYACLDEVCSLAGTALNRAQPDDVHDFRIALRRLRDAVEDFKPYARVDGVASLLHHLKKTTNVLGTLRDHDVMIKMLKYLSEETPHEFSIGIKEFIRRAHIERDSLFESLKATMDNHAIEKLQKKFSNKLEHALKTRNQEDNKSKHSGFDFRKICREIIMSRLEELQKLSLSFYKPFDSKTLYRVRKSARRLQYALELFASRWQEQKVLSLAEEIAELQRSLGKLHDCEVVIHLVGSWLTTHNALHKDMKAHEEQRQAAVWMLSHLVKSHAKHFCEALTLWYEWEKSNKYHETLATIQ